MFCAMMAAILIMAHPYSRNRYRGRIPCFLVDFGPDPDLDPDSGCHNSNCCQDGGLIAGAGADLEHAVRRPGIERLRHERHDEGLRKGLVVADGQGPVGVGEESDKGRAFRPPQTTKFEASSVKGKRVSVAVKGKRVSVAVKGKRVSVAVKGKRVSVAVKSKRVSVAVKSKRVSMAVKGKRVSVAVKGKRVSVAVKSKRVSVVVKGKRVSVAVKGKRVSVGVKGKRVRVSE
jgi:hypothetical protein